MVAKMPGAKASESDDAKWLPIAEIAKRVQAGELKAVDLVEQSLRAIDDNAEYHAVLWTLEQRARARAIEIDAAVAKGEAAGRLAGVPFIAKDNFLVFGAETTAASNILKGFDAPYQATAINRLEAEGAICVAKANLDAFAHGGSTENSDFGPTKNPYDPERIPGGSSGGSAAAVVLQLAPFAVGSDTGGSIRQPASMSGCVGMKPTYGLVSRSGVVAMASSLDTVGPLARTVEDTGLVLDVMAGVDPLDSTTIERQKQGYIVASTTVENAGDQRSLQGKRIGVIQEYMSEGLRPNVKQVLDVALEKMKAAGAVIEPISLPSLPLSLAVYYILCPAEISSNLSRYDGQRYAYNYPEAQDLYESFAKTRDRGFGKEAKRRIMIGTYVLSSGYYDAYYRKAQTVRTKIIKEFEAAFEKVDFLYGPTAPSAAFKLGEKVGDPMQLYLEDIMTVAVNLAGVPAISVPAGLSSEGLPVGLQLMASQCHDAELLEVAASVQGVIGTILRSGTGNEAAV
jgi:aspartyl-tRNA(Asn)/glutamyl-tRNA(Gln) amidotransferase subunit A